MAFHRHSCLHHVLSVQPSNTLVQSLRLKLGIGDSGGGRIFWCYTKAHSCDNSGIKEAILSRESDNWNDRKDKSVDPSKELRLHWDLYTMMDEWVEPCDDLVAKRDPHDSCVGGVKLKLEVVTTVPPVASSSLFDDDDYYDEDEEEEPRKELQTMSLPGPYVYQEEQLQLMMGKSPLIDPKSHPQLHILLIKVVVRDLMDNESNLKGEPQSIWLHQLKGQMTSIMYMLIMHIIDMKTSILSRSQLGLRTIRLRPHYGEVIFISTPLPFFPTFHLL
ncbi:hypothetical protein Tco_1156992 [Tanacetum coccineum]